MDLNHVIYFVISPTSVPKRSMFWKAKLVFKKTLNFGTEVILIKDKRFFCMGGCCNILGTRQNLF
jgi:hypothetical protein